MPVAAYLLTLYSTISHASFRLLYVGLNCYITCSWLVPYFFISVLLHRYMVSLQLLIIFLVRNLLQTVAEVMPFDRDRVASMIVRDVSITNRAPHSNFVYTIVLVCTSHWVLLSGLTCTFVISGKLVYNL